jgi:hypothetical protein
MEPMSPAEELPALYRALLDRVAQIEADGRRTAAYRLRRDATRIYSRSWDDRARRALQHLLDRTGGARTNQPESGRETRRSSAAA